MEWYDWFWAIPAVLIGGWLHDKQKKFIGRSLHGWDYRDKSKSKYRNKYRR